MFKNLSSLLKKPALYERTPEKFWNDPHISKGMLEAHLNPQAHYVPYLKSRRIK